MPVLTDFGTTAKIQIIKAVREHMRTDLLETKGWIENLPWSFNNEALAASLRNLGCIVEDTLPVLIAVGMWLEDGKWKTYAEGWEPGEASGQSDIKESCESTIFSNALNRGQPVYWRFIEANIPKPAHTEPTVRGAVLPEGDEQDA